MSLREAEPTPEEETCLCYQFVGVTEAAALAAGRWMGSGDAPGARGAAVDATCSALAGLAIEGRVVIGEGEPGDASKLYLGEQVGAGGRRCDLALDPLQATSSLTRGQNGAMSVIAVAAPQHMLSAPDMYMQKMVVGARAAGRIDIDASVPDNIKAIADAHDRKTSEITIITLDRPRHEDLVGEIRAAGARIKLIPDGDITASISAAVQGTGDHAYIGIGGTAEGIITAAAMRCLGGDIQAKLWPMSRREVQKALDLGIDDIEAPLSTKDMVQGDVVFAATGVTRGDFLKGVHYFRDGARSQSLVMCTRCRSVRFVDAIHLFTEERREIRL
jgi:fructose-1,6-bisphosphatase II